MNSFRKVIVLGLAALALLPNLASAQGTSPHGFYAPQCTWSADWNAWWRGWNLQFSRNWGRDAYLWWDLVQNAQRGFWPRTNAILVVHNSANGGIGGTAGHVLYVTGASYWYWNSSWGYWTYLRASHSNWPWNSWMHDDTFIWRSVDGKIVRNGESTWRTTRGFLYRP